MYLNDDPCDSLNTEVGVLTTIIGHGPTPEEGGTYHHRQRDHIQGARNRLLLRWLLIHVLVVGLDSITRLSRTSSWDSLNLQHPKCSSHHLITL
ncbi:hypothetical protein AVEN_257623-1 [Araneus ventricosus]|uniref:Uncharacterized protein n=1 Tax=Araneus ventricosus TaxID=182803 RepID=A0A4Y2E6Q2_ARAVE|nr:hypothetical protein AVEN_257623-1 [Araneus ventricosus]